jgi:hypothetical protein
VRRGLGGQNRASGGGAQPTTTQETTTMSKDNNQFLRITPKSADDIIKSGACVTLSIIATREFVEWALARNSHNRKLSMKVVRQYAAMMQEGKWMFTNNGIAFTKSGYLADGQHRLAAIQYAGFPEVAMNVTFGIENDAQMVIDRNKIRSAADGVSLTTNIIITKSQGGSLVWLWSIENGKRAVARNLDPFEYRAMAEKYYDAIVEVQNAANLRGLSSTFFAPLIYLYAHGENLTTIRDFVNGISTGEGLSRGDPRLKYRNEFVVSSGLTGKGGRARDDAFVAAAQLFMAYAEGRTVMAFIPHELGKVFAELRARAEKLEKAKEAC